MKLKTQKKAVLILSGFIFFTIFVSLILYIENLQNSILPNTIVYDINNAKLEAHLKDQISETVLEAKKNYSSRKTLILKITQILNQYDAIDTFSLRLGFDKKLIVHASVQSPVLGIHTKDNDTYIIGSAMKIMAKNPDKSLIDSLPNIYLNEVEIKDKKSNLPIDFSKLVNQVSLIYEHYQWYHFKMNKLIWTQFEGFVLKFYPDDTQDTQTSPLPLTVYLGYENLDQKIKKFKSIQSMVKQKNLNISEIDLDLLDRAFIK